MARYRSKSCARCGVRFQPSGPRSLYCAACKDKPRAPLPKEGAKPKPRPKPETDVEADAQRQGERQRERRRKRAQEADERVKSRIGARLEQIEREHMDRYHEENDA